MKGSTVCSADAVLQKHDSKCTTCGEAVTSILVQTGRTKSHRDRQWILAHFERRTQTYMRHVCPPDPEPVRKAA